MLFSPPRKKIERWEKRFAEDLVEVLSLMGHPPGPTVSLALTDPATGTATTVPRAPMTTENRRAIWQARRQEPPKRQNLKAALKHFQQVLLESWSYREASQFDVQALTRPIEEKLKRGLSENELGIELAQVLAQGIDGHASLEGFRLPGHAFLPFLVEPLGNDFVALKPDRSGFLAADFPYLKAILA